MKELMSVVRKVVKIEIDLSAGAKHLSKEIIQPKLQVIVDKSSNVFDNIALVALVPEMDNALMEAADKYGKIVNGKIRKLLGYDEEVSK